MQLLSRIFFIVSIFFVFIYNQLQFKLYWWKSIYYVAAEAKIATQICIVGSHKLF